MLLKAKLLETWKGKLSNVALNESFEKIAQETIYWVSMCSALDTFFKDIEAYIEIIKKHEKEGL